MIGKKAGADAGTVVDDLRDDIDDMTREVGDMTREVGKPMRRWPGSWAAAVAGVLAGTAAVATLRWRKARRTPKSRAERAWREVRNRVRKAARAAR